MSVSVCLCVCLSVRDHIFETTLSIFTRFFCACYLYMLPVYVTCGRGSVLLWRRNDVLRISGFMAGA